MPPYHRYASAAQRRWAHTAKGIAALGAADVAGKDRASKGVALPERASMTALARHARPRKRH